MTTIRVSSTTLFHVACIYLNDATQWTSLAMLNNIADPWLSGVTELGIPVSATQMVSPLAFS